MLTDDDLLRELAEAMREETADLRYAGRVPTPRRPLTAPLTAVPIAAAAAAVLVLPQLDGGGTRSAAPAPPSATAAPTTATPAPTAAAPELVTDTIELAGMTLRYRHAPGTPPPETLLFLGVEPPEDAQEVDLTDSPEAGWLVAAWVGTSPEIGKPGLFVQTHSDGIGEYSFFTADGVTAADWEQMVRTGSN